MSAYAAPDTPIASAKRPRPSTTRRVEIPSLNFVSPVKTLRYEENDELSPMRPARHDKHTVKAKLASEPRVPVPLALFSPVLVKDKMDTGRSSDNGGQPDSARSMGYNSDTGDFEDDDNLDTERSLNCDSQMLVSEHEVSTPVQNILRADASRPCTPVSNTYHQLKMSHSTPQSTPKDRVQNSGSSSDSKADSLGSTTSSDNSSLSIDEPNENELTSIQQQTLQQPTDDDSSEIDDDEDDDEYEDDDVFNPYQFMVNLPPHETVYDRRKVCLPPKHNSHTHGFKHTLVLDLDETLVHCTIDPVDSPDMVFPVHCNGGCYEVYVRKRPYLDYFLQTVSKQFEVVVFTASQRIYANVLLDKLDPQNQLIHHRLFREACVLVQGNYLKDLTVLDRDLSKTVLVDNSPHAYGFQIDNGIPIESWFDDSSDTELLKLVGFLKHMHRVEDVRDLVREHFRTHELLDSVRQQQQRQMQRQQQQQQQQQQQENRKELEQQQPQQAY